MQVMCACDIVINSRIGMKIEAQDLWPLILDFVETNFGEEDLKVFKKYFSIKINHHVSPSLYSHQHFTHT